MRNTLKLLNGKGLEIMKETGLCFYPFEDIIAIETERPYLKLHTQTEKFLFTGSLSVISQHAPPFFRACNKSVWVNLLYVSEFTTADNSCQVVTPVKSFPLACRRQAGIILAYSEIKAALGKQGECRYCKLKNITV
ncbi:MAG TPA: LytTR family DNA-binding domain-containing protein [Paludibacter sp.]|nr:LytTR family DNA-binding domain-containing protein [Paludibacter sp.]